MKNNYFTVLAILFNAAMFMSCNDSSRTGGGTDGISSLYATAYSYGSSGTTVSCNQSRIIGNNATGTAVESICGKLQNNTFRKNIGALQQAIKSSISQTNADPQSEQFARMQFLILCGEGPVHPTTPYPAGSFGLSSGGRQITTCTDARQTIIDNFGSDTDTKKWPEWNVFNSLIKRTIPLVPRPGINFNTDAVVNKATLPQEEAAVLASHNFLHTFSARDIIKNRLGALSGCTGAAKVFAFLARTLGYSVRYIATVGIDEYKRVCCEDYSSCTGHEPGDYFKVGHQVVAIQMPDGKWQILNSSRYADSSVNVINENGKKEKDLNWAVDAKNNPVTANDPEKFIGRTVYFPDNEEAFMVTAVENSDWFDDLSIEKPSTVENLYASGKRTDPLCRFDF